MKQIVLMASLLLSWQVVGCGPSGGSQQLPPAPVVDEPPAQADASNPS